MENQEGNFEVNLLPVISLLAVCISFLLVTAVWLPIGTLDIKQAIGESSDNKGEPSRFAIQMTSDAQYNVSVEQEGKSVKNIKVDAKSQDGKQIESIMEKLKESYPEITMVFVQPKSGTKYESLVALLDILKKIDLKEIGIEPEM